MGDGKMETRLRLLEKVVDKLLIQKRMSDKTTTGNPDNIENQSGTGDAPPIQPGTGDVKTILTQDPPPITGDDVRDTFELVYRKFDVKSPKNGKLITVTREVLENDPQLLAWLREKHPDCFKS